MADFSGHSQCVGPVAKTYDYRWGKVGQGKLCRGPDSRAAALPGDFKPGVAGFPEGGVLEMHFSGRDPQRRQGNRRASGPRGLDQRWLPRFCSRTTLKFTSVVESSRLTNGPDDFEGDLGVDTAVTV